MPAKYKWKFAPGAEPFDSSESMSIALLDTGYLDPQDYLTDLAQYDRLLSAIEVVKDFISAMHEANLVEYH